MPFETLGALRTQAGISSELAVVLLLGFTIFMAVLVYLFALSFL